MQYEALLRGVNFRPIEAKLKVSELAEGQELTLERDPHNEFDPNAIKVIDPDSQIFLGFVAKEVAVDLAPEMESGMAWTCTTGMKVPNTRGNFDWTLNIETTDAEVYDDSVND